MKNFYVLCKLNSQLSLFVTIIIASTIGCVNTLTSTPISNSAILSNVGLAATQEITAPRSLNPTIPLTATFTLQSLNPATLLPVNLAPDPFHTMIQPEDIVWEMLGQISIDRALNDLKQLTGDAPICLNNECYTIANRFTGQEGLTWAKEYISKELVGLGYSVEIQSWSHSGYVDQNIIARKPGVLHPEEEIYFVAHIDGVNTGGDERFPAADDDASGVVDLIELARVLSSYSFSRTVVLLFSSGEEQGTLGVQSYLSQLSSIELSSIKYAIDIDMIGYDSNHDSLMELWHGGESKSIDLASMLSDIIRAYQLDLEPVLVVGCG